ncbi:glycosyltransferase [Roseitranquillus sediminis]|uniref:glycosyltransferase n=1 Tax=Roseitranquillus sediminis TaxID=2809051 RepID=UPI001D0C9B43|nr:glycosyltransferase [Roseitranquillus sediminis]MBM9593843.1 glycosyltransferase [Roseitranquillus sediminis]
MTKPRLGIVVTEFGIPSEVWSIRQAEAFAAFEPVYFAQGRRADGLALPEGRELHLFGAGGGGPLRRMQRKLGLAAGALPAPAALGRMDEMLAEARIDMVLAHFAWNAIPLVEAVRGRIPVVAHVHGRDVTSLLRFRHYRRALARALPRFAHVIAVGRYQQDVIAGLAPGVESSLIPCGAPTSVFAARPLPERDAGDPAVFISVGRVSPEKGQLQSLAAFERVATEVPDARLVLVGDGPQMATLRARVAESPVGDRVRLTGLLPSDRVAEELAAAHVYLQHSRPEGGWMEGFPTTLVEAGAAGLPLIATRVGGTPDQVFDGENGVLIEPDDVTAQATAMRRLATDEALRRRLGARAREVARTYDSAATTRRLEEVLLRHLPSA